MNLIKDGWIPASRSDGSVCFIAPWEIGKSDNPVTEIKAPRPDFRGALYQFLIGLVQTTFSPEEEEDWTDYWGNIPSCDELKNAFEKYADAFELYSENGPAFMQDFHLPDSAVENTISSLLIDAPGGNTVVLNKDHFVKRDTVRCMCPSCAATALFTLQTNAPSGGQGNRTGMRGGGPLTTLVMPDSVENLWQKIWLNVLPRAGLSDSSLPDVRDSSVFPWLAETRESCNDEKVYPSDVNILQQFWGMPRRIRLAKSSEQGICDVCGRKGDLYVSYSAKNYGISYSSTWHHVLSPYRKQVEKDGTESLLALKGKQGGLTYTDWMPLTLFSSFDTNSAQMADVVSAFCFFKMKFEPFAGTGWHIWCFGYDMENMKARCWYDQKMPIFFVPDDMRNKYIETMQKVSTAATDCARTLQSQVKAAWSDNPKDIKGDVSFIEAAFYAETESMFYKTADTILKQVSGKQGGLEKNVSLELQHWRKYIIRKVNELFDRFALQDTDVTANMKRVVHAAKLLGIYLNKDKAIEQLKEEA
ncbi:MAG: type I-E CRISPR-associated protein Cse1/CasA [Treponema sp.]|nr:type I-E CRISPR-associated protein Cse1/CasA [Treponema sp.]